MHRVIVASVAGVIKAERVPQEIGDGASVVWFEQPWHVEGVGVLSTFRDW